MASVTEATFNWGGFLAAMGSNITFQSRNVLSKKFMGKDTKVRAYQTMFEYVEKVADFRADPCFQSACRPTSALSEK